MKGKIKMENNFIFTQTKETVMTFEKTVTVETEKLETVDAFGHKKLVKVSHTENVDFHNKDINAGRAA